jgi:hypothetical protein
MTPSPKNATLLKFRLLDALAEKITSAASKSRHAEVDVPLQGPFPDCKPRPRHLPECAWRSGH